MKVTERGQQSWDAIVERFRAACILHRNGKEWESRRIIKEELPPMIKTWMQILPSGLKEDAKADLRDMFTREQSIVDQGHKLQNLFKETLVKRIIPQIEAKIASKYRAIYVSKLEQKRQDREHSLNSSSWVRPSYNEDGSSADLDRDTFNTGEQRVKIGDISGMIDALQENDTEALADSILSLEDIVADMNESEIGPILSNNS